MKLRKAVIPAAGSGTRLLPATKVQPKEMLPVFDRPAIQYVIEEAVAAGLTEILIITGRGKRAIEDHFDHSLELEHFLEEKGDTENLDEVRRIANLATIHFVRQKKPLGLGHAVACAEAFAAGEPFAVLLGDDIFLGDFTAAANPISQLKATFEREGKAVVGVERIPRERVGAYGVVKPADAGAPRPQGSPASAAGSANASGSAGAAFAVSDLVEKPAPAEAPSDLGIIGRYVLTADVFEALRSTAPDARGEIQLTDGLRDLAANGSLLGQVIEGERYDIGNKVDFVKASVEFGLARPEFRDELSAWVAELAARLERGEYPGG